MARRDRDKIFERRARLVAAALASVSACTPQCNPFVCLSMSNPGRGPHPRRTASATVDAGALQTVVGVARDEEAGAALVADDAPIYIDGLAAWPDEVVGKWVSVTGSVVEREGLPPSAQPTDAGIVGSHRVIEKPTWKLVE